MHCNFVFLVVHFLGYVRDMRHGGVSGFHCVFEMGLVNVK